MMQGAVGVLILSALVCLGLGSGHHHRGHDYNLRPRPTPKATAKKVNAGHEGLSNASPSGRESNSADDPANSLSMVTSANRDFAFNLYRKLANQTDNQGKNIFFSPSSVSLALATLSVGARGQTHQQLFSALGFNSSLTQTDVDQAFRGLLTAASKTSSEDISAGVAMFVDGGFTPKQNFLGVVKDSYLAYFKNVNFQKINASVTTINNYVTEQTHGKINQLVKTVDPNTLMYLISYIYYKGKWQTRFDPARTKKEMFNVDEQNQVPVQMMNAEARFNVFYDNQTWILRLPFNNSYSMLLMLPDRRRGLAELEQHICPTHYAKWLQGLKRDALTLPKYNLFIPKFSINTKMNLKGVLRQMGITDMFGAEADLSGAVGRKGTMRVSQVKHQATLDIDETGATATAVTNVVFVLRTHVPDLKFNRPFMVLIADPSDNILFLGKILNPNL